MALGRVTQTLPASPQTLDNVRETTHFSAAQPSKTELTVPRETPTARRLPACMSYYKVSEQRDDGDLNLVNISKANGGPRNIAMTRDDFARSNRRGIVPINWNMAEPLPRNSSPLIPETESSDDED
jgi:hypothetical protein